MHSTEFPLDTLIILTNPGKSTCVIIHSGSKNNTHIITTYTGSDISDGFFATKTSIFGIIGPSYSCYRRFTGCIFKDTFSYFIVNVPILKIFAISFKIRLTKRRAHGDSSVYAGLRFFQHRVELTRHGLTIFSIESTGNHLELLDYRWIHRNSIPSHNRAHR